MPVRPKSGRLTYFVQSPMRWRGLRHRPAVLGSPIVISIVMLVLAEALAIDVAVQFFAAWCMTTLYEN